MASKNEVANVEINVNGEKAINSLRSVRSELRAMNAEWGKMEIGTQEWLNQQDKIKDKKQYYAELTKEVRSTGGAMSELKSQLDDSWFGKMKTGFLAISGVIAGAAGVFKIFKDAIATSDSLTDKWEETVMGAKEGYSALLRTIASGDWSNLLNNVNAAITAGREYAKTLDEINERQASLNIVEAQTKMQINDLIQTSKDQRLSDEERAKAAKSALDLENGLLSKRMDLAMTAFKSDLNLAASQTGLSEATVANYVKQRDANNELIKQAEQYHEAVSRLASAQEKVSTSRGLDPTAIEDVTKYKEVIDNTTKSVKVYADEVVARFGKGDAKLTFDKLSQSYADIYNKQNDFKEGTRRLQSSYTGFLKSIRDEEKKDQQGRDKSFADSLEEKIRKAKEAHEKLIRDSEALAKEYEQILLKGQDTITDESVKNAESTYQFRLKFGVATADEIMAHEMSAITKTAEFARLSAGEQAQVIANAYQAALQKIAKAAPIESVSAYGGEGEDTFQPDFDPSTIGTPENMPMAKDDAQAKRDAWVKKANEVIAYAQVVRDMYAEINNIIAESENAQLRKDEETNNKKKANLKKQLDGKTISQKQYDDQVAAMDADLDKKKRKIAHDQAVREKEMRAMSALINTATAITGALAAVPGPGGIVLAILVGLLGAYQLAQILSAKVPQAKRGRWGAVNQAAGGRYDVIGEEDGRSYTADYSGTARTGIYSRPTLVSELGPELVVDAPTTRNIQMNYPWILDAINYSKVPQRGNGSYPESSSGGQASGKLTVGFDDETKQIMNDFKDQLKNGVNASVVYDDLRNSMDTVERIESNVTR